MTSNFDQTVRDWYVSAFPSDDLGQEINPALTFIGAVDAIPSGGAFYDALGVGDSCVRERVFDEIARLCDVSYADVYDAWISGSPVMFFENDYVVETFWEAPYNSDIDGVPFDSLEEARKQFDDEIFIIRHECDFPYTGSPRTGHHVRLVEETLAYVGSAISDGGDDLYGTASRRVLEEWVL